MFFFFGYGPGIFFVLLGPFIILGGLRRPEAGTRLLVSGSGSIIVGLGNLLMVRSLAAGLAVVALGFGVILYAAKMRS